MSFFFSFIRFVLYSLVLIFAPMSTLFIFFGIFGVYFVLFFYIVLLLSVFLFSDRFIQRYFPVAEKVQKNLEFSFVNLIEELYEEYPQLRSHNPPKFIVYQDPSPNMLVFRLPFKQGKFFMSQGMLTLLNETEVRLIAVNALRRYRDVELYTSSICSILTLMVLYIIPKAWIKLVLDANTLPGKKLEVWTGLFFITIFPFLKALLTLGRKSEWRSNHALPVFIVKKIQKDQAWWTYARRLGFSDLYLAEPISS